MANELKLKNCQFLYSYWLLSTQKHFLLTPPHAEPSSGARCFRSWEKKWSSEASSSSSSRHFKFLWPTSIAWGLAENNHLSPSFHETCPFKSQARKRSRAFTKVPQKEKLGAGILHSANLVIWQPGKSSVYSLDQYYLRHCFNNARQIIWDKICFCYFHWLVIGDWWLVFEVFKSCSDEMLPRSSISGITAQSFNVIRDRGGQGNPLPHNLQHNHIKSHT